MSDFRDTPAAIPAAPANSSADTIETHINCVACGYDLRGLSRSGACPECGRAIAESLHGKWLRYADRDWLKSILAGANVLALSIRGIWLCFFLWLAILLAGVAVQVAVDNTPNEVPFERAFDTFGKAYAIIFVLLAVAASFAVWRMAAEPPHESTPHVARVMVRLTSLLVVPVAGLLLIGLEHAGSIVQRAVVFHAYLLVLVVFVVSASVLLAKLGARTELGRDIKREPSWTDFLALPAFLVIVFWMEMFMGRDGTGALALSGVLWFFFLTYFATLKRALWREMNPASPMPARRKQWWRTN